MHSNPPHIDKFHNDDTGEYPAVPTRIDNPQPQPTTWQLGVLSFVLTAIGVGVAIFLAAALIHAFTQPNGIADWTK